MFAEPHWKLQKYRTLLIPLYALRTCTEEEGDMIHRTANVHWCWCLSSPCGRAPWQLDGMCFPLSALVMSIGYQNFDHQNLLLTDLVIGRPGSKFLETSWPAYLTNSFIHQEISTFAINFKYLMLKNVIKKIQPYVIKKMKNKDIMHNSTRETER